ncbi:MAG: DUF2911 domain-containing protein [Gemmatimonadales bacterium]|nr:DUF2911 domain-containing protein [Gemmatimonadales bacterium]
MLFATLATLLATPALAPAAPPSGCIVMGMKAEGRKSPLDSLSFTVGTSDVKVCYGRPSARGRAIFPGVVKFGQLWRFGANEPTMIHTSGPLVIAGVKVGAGSYSLYAVPGDKEWEVIVNRSVKQWGEESGYTDEVKKQEVGRGKVKAEAAAAPVEQLTFSAAAKGAKELVVEWEKTKVRIPLGS